MGNKPSYFAKAPENVARVFLTGGEHREVTGFPWPPLPALVRPAPPAAGAARPCLAGGTARRLPGGATED